MKLNLGCGNDIREGYMNVDLDGPPEVWKCDLSRLPWVFHSNSAEEILMLDFLEHFPYSKTDLILQEVWRVLKPGGFVDIQVPDFEHCSRAATFRRPFLCNRCGWEYAEKLETLAVKVTACEKCGQTWEECAEAAIHRLYGGQDREGNWHYTAFTKQLMASILSRNGFHNFEYLEKDHQYANWNFKIRAHKGEIPW